jgi:hypothetical protein
MGISLPGRTEEILTPIKFKSRDMKSFPANVRRPVVIRLCHGKCSYTLWCFTSPVKVTNENIARNGLNHCTYSSRGSAENTQNSCLD